MPPAITKFFKRTESTIIIGVILMIIIFAAVDSHGFFHFFTIRNITRFAALLGFVAIGQTLLILTREIDLSVGSVYGVVGIAFVTLEPTLGVTGSFVVAMMLAAFIGWLNSVLVIKAGLSAVIVTLSGLFFYRGVIYVATGGSVRSFSGATEEHWLVQLLGGNWLFGLENALWWFILAVIIFTYVLFKTSFGNHLLAIGGHLQSAASRGVKVDTVKAWAFVICSMMAGLAGIITLANEPRTHVTIGQDVELEAISAAVIGGVLLTGGRGSIVGAALGTFFLVAVRSELITMGAPPTWYRSFVGLVLIIAAVLNTTVQRRLTATA